MRAKLTVPLMLMGLLLGPARGLAHHSFSAEFDANRPITLNGVVTNVEWTNPHTYFYVEVKDKEGRVVNWIF